MPAGLMVTPPPTKHAVHPGERPPLPEGGSLPTARELGQDFFFCRQRITLDKEFFAEYRALGKKGHSAKDFFAECQTLGKSSALGIGCLA